MDCRRGKTLSYNDVGTFAAYNRMVREIGAAGFAIGASQVGSPVGLMFGHYIVSKWRNLNQQQRAELHGIVEGDRRTGPLLVTIYDDAPREARSEEHTSELQSLMRISYAVFCLKKKNKENSKSNVKKTT